MPSTPYIVYGTVTDIDGNVVANLPVMAKNSTDSTSVSVQTNSLGQYVLDLANAGYTVGDSINMLSVDGKYLGEATFTITGEGKLQNLTVNYIEGSTVSDKAWLALSNHLQTGTYEISTDHIYAAMNDVLVKNVGYPFVIIEPPTISNTKMVLNRDGIKNRVVSFNIRIYNKSAETTKTLRDEVENSIDTGWRRLAGVGLKNLEFSEGDYDWFSDGDNGTIHFYIVPVRFRYVVI